MPLGKGVRFRFKIISPRKAQRLAFKGSNVIEVVGYHRANGVWIKDHSRSPPRRRH